MISSGMMVGSWNYLKWGYLSVVARNGSIVAAKIKLFNTKTNTYYNSYITPEAYNTVKDWMDFRAVLGIELLPFHG